MKTEILKLIDSYWKFDDNQQPLSSWHDKQDLLKAVDELSTPALTPEKLGEMFDAKAIAWDEVSPGSKVMESQEFIEIAQQIASQTRQPETEINLPSDEAVRDWFKVENYRNGKLISGEWSNGQVCDEIIKALKHFMKPKNE